MMKMLGIAAALLAVGITNADAQYGSPRRGPPEPSYSAPPPPPAYRRDHHPYAKQHHATCHQKAWRLRHYERVAGGDGRYSFRERREIASLRRDLDRTCGHYRWRG